MQYLQVTPQNVVLVPGKHIELGVGLEIKDDFLRNVCINKGFTLVTFSAAAKIIAKKLSLRTYVLLKPLLLALITRCL